MVNVPLTIVKSVPSAVLPQKIFVSPAQLQQNLAQVASVKNTLSGTHNVITVLRFTEPSKTLTTTPRSPAVQTLAATNIVPLRPRFPPATASVTSKVSPAPAAPPKISAAPSSQQISQQLAQIGIDAIVAQVEQVLL